MPQLRPQKEWQFDVPAMMTDDDDHDDHDDGDDGDAQRWRR